MKVFPEIGNLQAYLLASDYAIAGLATTPTPAEMAVVLQTIDAGGMKGLRLLNLPCSSLEEVTSSFQYVYEYLSQVIPTAWQQQMKFNIFVVEHSLCKYSSSKRLNNDKFHVIENLLVELSPVCVYNQNLSGALTEHWSERGSVVTLFKL